MSLFVTSLNSGSNGNCYYIGNETEAILVDAGISCSEIEKRMQRLGLGMQNVKAIFISHEHTDHVSGLRVVAKKYQLPVYITQPTLRFGRLKLDVNLVNTFAPHQAVRIGSLSITAFPKFHDAADPYSFIIDCDNIKVGVFTDIGVACENVITHFKQCHAAFLETNYDEKMLEQGGYPFVLKNRIRGDKGHLSNTQALELFIKHKPPFMSHIFLSHLSKNNNSPELVYKLFSEHSDGVKIAVASRDEAMEVYPINAPAVASSNNHSYYVPRQLSFAFA